MAAVRAGANDYLIKTSFSRGEFYRKLNYLVPGTIRESPHLNEPRASAIDRAASVTGSAPGKSGSNAIQDQSHGGRGQDAAQAAIAEDVLAASLQNDAAVDSQLQVMIDGWE